MRFDRKYSTLEPADRHIPGRQHPAADVYVLSTCTSSGYHRPARTAATAAPCRPSTTHPPTERHWGWAWSSRPGHVAVSHSALQRQPGSVDRIGAASPPGFTMCARALFVEQPVELGRRRVDHLVAKGTFQQDDAGPGAVRGGELGPRVRAPNPGRRRTPRTAGRSARRAGSRRGRSTLLEDGGLALRRFGGAFTGVFTKEEI